MLKARNKVLTIALLILSCASLVSCAAAVKVVNCPAWVETGTAGAGDTIETKRWMYRFETNRQRECR